MVQKPSRASGQSKASGLSEASSRASSLSHPLNAADLLDGESGYDCCCPRRTLKKAKRSVTEEIRICACGCCSGILVLLLLVFVEVELRVNKGHDASRKTLLFAVPILALLWKIGRQVTKQERRWEEECDQGVPEATVQYMLQLSERGEKFADGDVLKKLYDKLAGYQHELTSSSIRAGLREEETLDMVEDLDDPLLNTLLVDRSCWARFLDRCCWCCRQSRDPAVRFLKAISGGKTVATEEDWERHMHYNKNRIVRHHMRAQLLARRTYFAMCNPDDYPDPVTQGQPEGQDSKGYGLCRAIRRPISDWCMYKNDFFFYVANQHPLISLWHASEYNYLSKPDRLIAELWCIAATKLWTVFIHALGMHYRQPQCKVAGTYQEMAELAFYSLAVGQLMIVSPSWLLSVSAQLLIGWPTIPKNPLLPKRRSPQVEAFKCGVRIMMASSLVVLVPVALFFTAYVEGNIVLYIVFRCIMYVQWFPVTILKKFMPMRFPCLPLKFSCLYVPQAGKWWYERRLAGDGKNLHIREKTSLNLIVELMDQIFWLSICVVVGSVFYHRKLNSNLCWSQQVDS